MIPLTTFGWVNLILCDFDVKVEVKGQVLKGAVLCMDRSRKVLIVSYRVN